MKLKTHKTISKRVRVTKGGKLLKRKGGQNHFNSRERGNTTRNKRRDLEISKVYHTTLKQLMPHA